MDFTVAVSLAASIITLPRSISAPPPAEVSEDIVEDAAFPCEFDVDDVDEHEVMSNGIAVTNTAPASIFILFFIGIFVTWFWFFRVNDFIWPPAPAAPI
jgi:hypothetical protein